MGFKAMMSAILGSHDARPNEEILKNPGSPPYLLRARSSSNFITISMGLGLLTDMALYGLIVPIMPFRLQSLGYDNFAALTGFLVAAYAGGLLISSPPIGILGEKVKSRRIALVGFLLFLCGSIVLFMLARKFAILLVARILQGFSGTALWVLGTALICESCEPENVGAVIGQAMIGFSIGICIGPPIGGVLYEQTGYYSPFYFALALIGFDIVLRLLIVEHKDAFKWITPQGRKETSNPYLPQTEFSTAREHGELKSLWLLCQSKRAGASIYLTVVGGFVIGALLEGSMTIYLQDKYGFDSMQAGLVFLAACAPSFITSPLCGRFIDKHGPKKPAVICVVWCAPMIALLAIPQLPAGAFIALVALFGAGANTSLVPIMADLSLLVGVIPGLGFAHVFGAFNTAFSLGTLIGPIIAGQILENLGHERGWQVVAGISAFLYFTAVPFLLLYTGDKRVMLAEKPVLQPKEPKDASASESDMPQTKAESIEA